ncbi:PUA-like domain-containing protein [Crassisporium funariophilum]|nr:PUA-like domain-containing protein [Crassisporium funariophilum]
MVSEYEKQRQANIRKNQELLIALGLDKPTFEPKQEPIKKKANTKKRQIVESSADDEDVPPAKVQRVEQSNSAQGSGVRRSSRNATKAIDYGKEISEASHISIAYSSGVKVSENTGPLGRQGGPRLHNPKRYGAIPGVEVGTWWESREDCSAAAIHAPWVGGISGGPQGAHSVVLNGGYDDDVDFGYSFTYTGSGGRDLKGTKANPKNRRTAPQSSDQTFENNFNKMLKRSCETKKPVRVVRGYKLISRYAPIEGYRYDGLYRVEKAWLEKGLNPKGYLVCKYTFKRLPGQPALGVRDTTHSGEDDVEPRVEETENVSSST